MASKSLVRTNEVGIYSHIYNKGVENKVIFNDKRDYETFLGYLKDYLTPPQAPENTKKAFTLNGRVFQGTPHQPKNYFNKVELIAYNIMPDHFHLVLHQLTRGSMEGLIRSLCIRYSMYFNKKYQRTGSLFDGPYKSIKISSDLNLLLFTRYLHHSAGNSSHTAYLDEKDSSWIKSKHITSLIEKGKDGYKDYVQNYTLDENEKEIITGLSFETNAHNLERRDLPTNGTNNTQDQGSNDPSEKIEQDDNMRPHQRLPELLVTGIVFLILFTIGTRNVLLTSAKSPKPITLGISSTLTIIPTQKENKVIKPKVMATIKINDGSVSVNIRSKPTSSSEKIGDASDGDIFELVSNETGWYEVRLASGSAGFISARYIVVNEINN